VLVDKEHSMKHISAFYNPKEKWIKKFAWFPKKSTISGKTIWFKFYWQNYIYMDGWGKVPIKGQYWCRNLTQHELLLEKLKTPEK